MIAPVRICIVFAALWLVAQTVHAHEVRPGLLQMTETSDGKFDTLWRLPIRQNRVLDLTPVFPEFCASVGLPKRIQDGARFEETSVVQCKSALGDASITIDGLNRTRTDVLIRIAYVDGGSETFRVTPDGPTVTLKGSQSLLQISGTYFVLGVEHILLGVDHLLFVTALLFLVSSWRLLLGTVTAFTVAHSTTLAAAVLGILALPPSIVETLIALSIAVVASEILLARRGQTGVAIERPWVVAFGFGLLHGFGFAGALREIGLPSEAVPAALLFFNVGVEIGQILYIAALGAVVFVLRRGVPQGLALASRALPIGIGLIAGFWTIERTIAMFS